VLNYSTVSPFEIDIILIAGYVVGLFLAFVVLVLSETGQPALLYIVPCVLIPIHLLAFFKGHFKDIWKGQPPTNWEM